MSYFLVLLVFGLWSGTIYALVALGYTMVYGVLKLINFAHGDVMMVGTYVGYATALQWKARGATGRAWTPGMGQVLTIFFVSMALCAVLGWLVERFAYRPLREKPKLTALITAIGISFVISYGFQMEVGFLPGPAPRAFPPLLKETTWLSLRGGEVTLSNIQVISFAVALGLMAALQWLVFKTRFGRAMRAVSFDHRTAALLGIPVDRVIAGTFMIGSALAAGAGLLFALKDSQVDPLMGTQQGLKAFVAAVIGGIGNVPGAVVGALLLGVVEQLVVGYAASSWRDAVAFGFLIVVLLLRPEGLFGRVTAEKV
ncbi:MAG: branched-chain amino acid transporter permease LivH [Pseudomonadota bacterium]